MTRIPHLVGGSLGPPQIDGGTGGWNAIRGLWTRSPRLQGARAAYYSKILNKNQGTAPPNSRLLLNTGL